MPPVLSTLRGNTEKFVITYDDASDDELAQDEVDVFKAFLSRFDVSGSRLLEIGGQVCLSQNHGAAQCWAIDPRNGSRADGDGSRMAINGRAEVLPPEIADVDFVFSCNAFEHVGALEETYRALRRAMRPGGIVYLHFGPIWSAPDGSHFEDIRIGGEPYTFWQKAIMPAWSHLLLGADDYLRLAVRLHGEEDGATLAGFVAHSPWVNRFTLRDHLDLPRKAGFEFEMVKACRRFGYVYEPPQPPAEFRSYFSHDAMEDVARRLNLTVEDLSVRDLRMVLRQV